MWDDHPKNRAFEAPEDRHDCPARSEHLGAGNDRDTDDPERLWGAAVTRIERLAGRWWLHNEEYSTEASHCPWCGVRLSDSHVDEGAEGEVEPGSAHERSLDDARAITDRVKALEPNSEVVVSGRLDTEVLVIVAEDPDDEDMHRRLEALRLALRGFPVGIGVQLMGRDLYETTKDVPGTVAYRLGYKEPRRHMDMIVREWVQTAARDPAQGDLFPAVTHFEQATSRAPHGGDLVFRGTTVPVSALGDMLRHGAPLEEFFDACPAVQRWQVEAVAALYREIDVIRTDYDETFRRLARGQDPAEEGSVNRGPLEEPTSRDPEVHSGDLVFSGTRVPVDTLFEIVDEVGNVPEGLDEFLSGYPTVERWKAEVVLVQRGQEERPEDPPSRPWLRGPGRITTKAGFLDLVDWLQRGTMEQWRELYGAARQNPEIWPEIRRALRHLTDPYLPSSQQVWEYLLNRLEREGQ